MKKPQTFWSRVVVASLLLASSVGAYAVCAWPCGNYCYQENGRWICVQHQCSGPGSTEVCYHLVY